MSQENVEIVPSAYEAANRRDWETAFRDQHPDVELILPPPSGTYRGREQIQGYWEDLLAAFDGASTELEEIVESVDRVVVVVKTRARPKGSSAEIEVRNGHLWTIRDGNATSMPVFPEPEKALEAASMRG
jgi:ketosteroid isomerase-like protein